MDEKLFRKILIILMVVCIVATVAHLTWDAFAYRRASIIYFIAKELWPNVP